MSIPQPPAGWDEIVPISDGYWRRRTAEFWMAFRAPSGLAVAVRYERDADGGAAPTAVLIERADGRALSVRDVKWLPLGEVMSAEMGRALLPWIGAPTGTLVEPLHDGPERLSHEHHSRVAALLYDLGPRSRVTIQQMCDGWRERYGEAVPMRTMSRWLARLGEYEHGPGMERLIADRTEQQRAMDALGPVPRD